MTEAQPGNTSGEEKYPPFPANPYEALGLTQGASKDEIKKAYRKLSGRYHPDQNSGDFENEEWFKIINEAKDILLHPKKNAKSRQYFIPGGKERFEEERQKQKEAEKIRQEAAAEKLRQEEEERKRVARENAEKLRQEQEARKKAEEEKLRTNKIAEIKARMEKSVSASTSSSNEEELRERKIAEISARMKKNTEEKIKVNPPQESESDIASELSEDEKKSLADYKATLLTKFNSIDALQEEIARKEEVLKAQEAAKASVEDLDSIKFVIRILKEVLAVLEKNKKRAEPIQNNNEERLRDKKRAEIKARMAKNEKATKK